MRALTIVVAAAASLTFFPPVAFAAPDPACLNTAISDRATTLKNAYKTYGDDMAKAVDALTKSEQDAVKNKDQTYTNTDTARAFSQLTYVVGDTWNRLNVTVAQAWSTYYGKRASCGYDGGSATTSYGAGYGYYGGYGYGGYGYQTQRCAAPVLSPLRAGCYYECAVDQNGCQRCRESCRAQTSYSSCGCNTSYDPVCARSGRTYDNACIAVCTGEQVWYDGSCR